MTTLRQHLAERGLLDSTQQKYEDVLETAADAGARSENELVRWLHRKVRDNTPIGTVLPARAAVKHYLVGVLGYEEDAVGTIDGKRLTVEGDVYERK